MKLRGYITALLIGFFIILPFIAHGSETDRAYAEHSYGIGAREWFSRADASWQISFPYITGAGVTGTAESELRFEHIDSPVAILNGFVGLGLDWTLEAEVGFGSISGGRGTDTDRFIASSGEVDVFSESESDISGDVRLWEINFYYQKRLSSTERSPWGLVLGLFHYQDDLKITNGVQTISVPFDGMTPPPLGPFSGLNSTYKFTWDTFKIGGLREGPLTGRLSYLLMFSLYPFVSYEGEGYWNLRAGTAPDDFRVQSPNFVQKANNGFGYDAMLALVYRITEGVELSAGYRYLHMEAKNGTDTVYFADSTSVSSNLDWVRVTRQGFHAGLLLKF